MELLAPTFPLIDSSSSKFLTLVTIVNQRMDLDRWMSLCELKNLRSLLVDTGRLAHGFDDRVAKGWTTHARANGALSQLHSFSLCSYNGLAATVSGRALDLLLDLPALTVLGLRGIHPRSNDQTLGWKRQQYVDISLAQLNALKYANQSRVSHDPGRISHGESNLASLYEQISEIWPSPAITEPIAKLVVCVGSTEDANVFRLSYGTISSFTRMIRRSVATKEQVKEVPSVNVKAETKPPNMRKRASIGSLFQSFA